MSAPRLWPSELGKCRVINFKSVSKHPTDVSKFTCKQQELWLTFIFMKYHKFCNELAIITEFIFICTVLAQKPWSGKVKTHES